MITTVRITNAEVLQSKKGSNYLKLIMETSKGSTIDAVMFPPDASNPRKTMSQKRQIAQLLKAAYPSIALNNVNEAPILQVYKAVANIVQQIGRSAPIQVHVFRNDRGYLTVPMYPVKVNDKWINPWLAADQTDSYFSAISASMFTGYKEVTESDLDNRKAFQSRDGASSDKPLEWKNVEYSQEDSQGSSASDASDVSKEDGDDDDPFGEGLLKGIQW
ncbi:MAG: hypothetical protein KatS3mg054_0011 [Chloroflexus sp.]|nr:MAG: hypothetical protein KatS3mg054_0011 [Chloroflexus sp.]